MSELQPVWQQVEQYLLDELSIIPVRDRDDENGYAKSPIGKWTYNQKNRFNKQELWDRLEKTGTSAVGIVCGKVSGNLEVIDVDSKYYPGIDATLFKDIQSFYPDIFATLRIHKTPSGGFHILYRISGGEPEGNQKLAGRIPTEFEVQEDKRKNPTKKRDLKEINFLETRGEGGQIVAPPSMGYSVYQDLPIPVITWEQRCSLIELCKTYNQLVKEERIYKPTQHDDKVYNVNPFEDYNARVDAVDLAIEVGFRRERENSHFVWFTRPGKSKGTSISWNKDKKVFFCFTSSTELEVNTGYRPSSLLSIYQHNGDRKRTYKWLVENGYGQIKPQVEKQIIHRAKVAGISVPANLSKEGLEALEAELQNEAEAHPHGIFWDLNDEDKYQISREQLYNVSYGLGFRLHLEEPVQIIGQEIYLSNKGKYFDALKSYIKEDDEREYIKICNALEAFLQNSGTYTITRLRPLNTDYILKDTFDTAYKLYQNGILEVTETLINKLEYTDIDTLLVWHHKILKRDLPNFNNEHLVCKYTDFLHHAIGVSDYLYQIIGYLAHDFKDENTGYIVTLTERSPDPKGGGGSGKNIFGNLLRYITTVCTVAGSQVQFNEKFLQAWNEERIFFMADVPKKFDFEYLKEMSTGYGTLKKLFKDERTIAPSDMPKMLVNTNFSFDASDGGLKRRILPVEFTNFFTAAGGVDAHYGCMFPAGWDQHDWAGFDWFMLTALQKYFQCKGKILAAELSSTGWEKQFKQKYSELTFKFIVENFDDWVALGQLKIDDFNHLYQSFCTENNISKQYQSSSIMMNRALTDYCERNEILFNPNDTISANGMKTKYKTFKKE